MTQKPRRSMTVEETTALIDMIEATSLAAVVDAISVYAADASLRDNRADQHGSAYRWARIARMMHDVKVSNDVERVSQ